MTSATNPMVLTEAAAPHGVTRSVGRFSPKSRGTTNLSTTMIVVAVGTKIPLMPATMKKLFWIEVISAARIAPTAPRISTLYTRCQPGTLPRTF